MISRTASRALVKTVAIFEAIKGGILLLAGFGILSLLHRDLRVLAGELVGWLHLDPQKHFASVFIETASNLTDTRLWLIAAFGFVYALFRFTEAFGLWKGFAWAEWVAVVSGGIYLPIEVYELARRFTWIRVTALSANLIVVILMAVVLWQNRKHSAGESKTAS